MWFIKKKSELYTGSKVATCNPVDFAELNRIINWRLVQNFELVDGMARKFNAWDSILRQIDKNTDAIANSANIKYMKFKPVKNKPVKNKKKK